MDVGFWAVVPPLLTIVLAIVTKEVLMSLFIGVFTGCMIIASWNPLGAMKEFFLTLGGGYGDGEFADYTVSGVLTDPWNMSVIIIVIFLGGLIGLLVRSGGAKAFGDLVQSKIKSRTGAMLMTWLIGCLLFFDDYFDVLTNGSTMRPVNDRFRISREKTSYILDSTGACICMIAPISSWVAFVSSLIGEAYDEAGLSGQAFQEFLASIPYNYYAWLGLALVPMVALFKLDFGPMAKAERRALTTGVVCEGTFSGGSADDDDYSAIKPSNGGAWTLLFPIIMLIVLAVVFMLYTGGFFGNWDLLEAVQLMDGMTALTYAILCVIVTAIIIYKITGLSTITESMQAFVVGTKSMLYVVLILGLAWSIGSVGDTLDTAGYVVSLFQDSVPGAVMPLIIFAFACAMTFATGATWGTYAIMIPLAVPLALAMDASVIVCVAAVIGGGGFGGHASPLADVTILASAASNVKHIDHVKTQIPYAMTCAGCGCVGYLVCGFVDGFLIPMLVTLAVFIVVVIVLKMIYGGDKSVSHSVGADGNFEDLPPIVEGDDNQDEQKDKE